MLVQYLHLRSPEGRPEAGKTNAEIRARRPEWGGAGMEPGGKPWQIQASSRLTPSMSTNQTLLSHRQSCDFHELESRFSTQSPLSLKKMTPETPLGSESPSLCVTYNSPSNASFTHTMSLSALPQTTAQKTAYLAALRQATAQMQEVINKELTQRMEEDNKKAAAAGDGGVNGENGKVDEKMEENYGEEFVEDN